MSNRGSSKRSRVVLAALIVSVILAPGTIVAAGALEGLPSIPTASAERIVERIAERTAEQNLVHGALNRRTSTEQVMTVAGTGIHGAADGSPAQFNMPSGIFSSAEGMLYTADTMNNLLRSIDLGGRVRRVTGEIHVHDELGFPHGFHRDGGINTAFFNRPTDGVVDMHGRILIVDSENNAIRIIYGQNVYTFAGSVSAGHADGSADEARFNRPTAIAICPQGDIYVADTLNHVIRKIDRSGEVTTIAGTPGASGSRDGETGNAQFNRPGGIAISQDGRIYIADTGNHLIRVIEDGSVRTLAGTLRFTGDVTWEGQAPLGNEPLGGFEDGAEAMFNTPMGLAIWQGNLIVADSLNHSIRAVLPNGETITLAGTAYPGYINASPRASAFHLPRGVYVLGDRLYIADTGNNVIRAMELPQILEGAG
ncbi:MAG: hypothetical protein FWC20_05790 [Oscillospiraceae bacterium]|nr:hypothetical protein [Oscillospiraceae bacterium]MCL2278905.1 hypothetical protein [Oscillospiraceae bacterium]